MKIELITKEQHQKLLSFYKNNPHLTLQNKGYETIKKDSLTDEDKDAIKEVEEILKKSISGFSTFSNFRLSKKTQELEIRFQYNWSYDSRGYFIGVGYILVDELLNGFRDN